MKRLGSSGKKFPIRLDLNIYLYTSILVKTIKIVTIWSSLLYGV